MEKQNLRETALFTTLTVYVYSIFILEANHETFWWRRCKKIGGMQNSWIQEVKIHHQWIQILFYPLSKILLKVFYLVRREYTREKQET